MMEVMKTGEGEVEEAAKSGEVLLVGLKDGMTDGVIVDRACKIRQGQ